MGWSDDVSGWCSAPLLLKAINSMPHLRILDIPDLSYGIFRHGSAGVCLQLPPTLEYCQGIRFDDSLRVTPLPNLRCLALANLEDSDTCLSLQRIFPILKKSCPHLRALK